MITDIKCKFCNRGYLVTEAWSNNELYCNYCYKRPNSDEVRHSRSGADVVVEEDIEENLMFPWWETKGW